MKHRAKSFSVTSELLVNAFTGRLCRQNSAKITTDDVGPGPRHRDMEGFLRSVSTGMFQAAERATIRIIRSMLKNKCHSVVMKSSVSAIVRQVRTVQRSGMRVIRLRVTMTLSANCRHIT